MMEIVTLDEKACVPSSGEGASSESYEGKEGLMVRFDSHKNPFLMLEHYCKNPQCDCNEAIIEFVEKDRAGMPLDSPMRFGLCLNLRTWQEDGEKPRSKTTLHLVDEFLKGLNDGMKSDFKEHYGYVKKKVRNAARFWMSSYEIELGNMVPYSDVFGDTGCVLSGGRGVSFRFEHDGKSYLVEDHYCINPECGCEEILLVFLSYSKEEEIISELFEGRLSFMGEMKLEEHPYCTKEEAGRLFEVWKMNEPDALGILKHRYREMKDVGRRLIGENAGHRTAPCQAFPGGEKSKIGRNDPCPCGSGRKYKKCCGRI